MMTIVRLWGVLGAGSVGKSTAIGHLVGDFGRGRNGLRQGRGAAMREILLRGGGYLWLFSRRMSLQEARKYPGVVVKDVANQIKRVRSENPSIEPAYINVLFALRTDQFGNFPRAEGYLSHFIRNDWEIKSLALLSPNAQDRQLYRRFGAPICFVRRSRQIDISHAVGQVRNHFRWA